MRRHSECAVVSVMIFVGRLRLRVVQDRFVECNVVLAVISEIEMILMIRVCFARADKETSWPDLGGF